MKWIISPRITKWLSWVIPVGAVTLWPFVISAKEPSRRTFVHEEIHGLQQQELWGTFWPLITGLAWLSAPSSLGFWLFLFSPLLAMIPFYVLYVGFWIKNLIVGMSSEEAYMAIPFEKEAYANEHDGRYLIVREPFTWTSYIWIS